MLQTVTHDTNALQPSQDLLCWQRLLARDEEALAEVYDAYSGLVYGVLRQLLDEATAQEVLQDVFLRLWDNPGAFDAQRGSLKVFLLVMARSRALDRLRVHRITLPLQDEDGVERPLRDDRAGAVQHTEQAAQREQLRQALGELSDSHQETVQRAFLQGQSREEIAQAMSVPVGTVKSRLSYALKYLKGVLGEGGKAWLD